MPELSLDSIAAMFFQTSNSIRDDFTENMQLLPVPVVTSRINLMRRFDISGMIWYLITGIESVHSAVI